MLKYKVGLRQIKYLALGEATSGATVKDCLLIRNRNRRDKGALSQMVTFFYVGMRSALMPITLLMTTPTRAFTCTSDSTFRWDAKMISSSNRTVP